MIQRIQSLYLVIGLILMGLLGWLPLGDILSGEVIYSFSVAGVQNTQTGQSLFSGWPLVVLLIIICLVQLLVIFGYKKRIAQMRMATFNILLMIGFVLICWFFFNRSIKNIGESTYALKVALSFPFISAILNYLAIRAIGRDEALVRSIDRIR